MQNVALQIESPCPATRLTLEEVHEAIYNITPEQVIASVRDVTARLRSINEQRAARLTKELCEAPVVAANAISEPVDMGTPTWEGDWNFDGPSCPF